jgi:hypothetical protein
MGVYEMNDTETDAELNGKEEQETELQDEVQVQEQESERPRLSLQKRLGVVLSRDEHVSADELKELLDEVNETADQKYAAAQEYKSASLDVNCEDVVGADNAQKALMLERQRLLMCIPRLEDKIRAAIRRDRRQSFEAVYRRTKAKLQEAAEKYAAYPDIIGELVDLFKLAKSVDAEVDAVNQNASAMGCEHLKHVEVLARNLPEGRFTREQPEISDTIVLPEWKNSNKQAWPPPRQSLGLLIAAASPPSYHPGDRWYEQQGDRRAEQEAEQARTATYYARQEQERQEREAREDALAAEERQRSGHP